MAILALVANYSFGQSKPKTIDTAINTPTPTTTAFKVPFDQVFKRNFDGTFSPLLPVQVNGEIMGAGRPFNRVTAFGGIVIGDFEGHQLLIDTVRGVVVLRKVL